MERNRVDQLKGNMRHNDLKGTLLETLMEAMQEAEDDPEKKDGIRIMRTIKRTSDCLHELKYFADLDKGKVKACDRTDVLALLERIQDQISVFWKTHAKPEGTIWD